MLAVFCTTAAVYRGYRDVTSGVVARAASGADVIVMHSREMQELLFEFYALTLLCRITLDDLKKYVAPTFVTPAGNLPNSVTDLRKGVTDCPLYTSFLESQTPLLRYLVDIRDCIVHHRSFATSDNTVAAQEEVDEAELRNGLGPWHEPVTRVTFRHVPPDGIAVNVLLPDAIFNYAPDGTRRNMVRRFTYNERINLLTRCREFVKLTVASVIGALSLLQNQRTPVYTWRRR